jgi:hypothetical protein
MPGIFIDAIFFSVRGYFTGNHLPPDDYDLALDRYSIPKTNRS